MGKYRLVFRNSVAKDLRGIPTADVSRILKRLEALADDPLGPGCEKLSGQGRCRVRPGWYRIVYEILQTGDHRPTIVVVKIGHRDEVYRRSQEPQGDHDPHA